MGKIKESIIDNEDFAIPSEEDGEEAAFYFFLHDLEYYTKSGKWGPHIWKNIDSQTKEIWSNLVHLNDCDVTIEGWKDGYCI